MSIFNKLLACGLFSTFYFLINTGNVFASISGVTVTPSSHIFEDTVISTKEVEGTKNISVFMIKHAKTVEEQIATKTFYLDIYDPNDKDGFYNPNLNNKVVKFTNNENNIWSIELGFNPVKIGTQSGVIYIRVASDSKMQNILEKIAINLSGKGLPNKPTLNYSPNQLYFGNLETGKSTNKQVKIENLTPDIYFLTIKCTSKHYAFTAQLEGESYDSCSKDTNLIIEAGSAKTLSINFSPLQEKNYTEDIVFNTDDIDKPTFKIRVTGTGIKPIENPAIGGIMTRMEKSTSEDSYKEQNPDNQEDEINDKGYPQVETTRSVESEKKENIGEMEQIIDKSKYGEKLEQDEHLTTDYSLLETNQGEGSNKSQITEEPEKNKTKGYLALILLIGLLTAGPIVSKKLLN